MRKIALIILACGPALFAVPRDSANTTERAKELQEYIQREKPAFKERESQKKDLLEALDRINSDQNHIRQRMATISSNQQELNMATENLSVEIQKQKDLEAFEKKRLLLLLKVVYRIKRDGLARFLIYDDHLKDIAGRIRVLYRTLRSHSSLTRQLEERAQRLAHTEEKLGEMKSELSHLLAELKEHESQLKKVLEKKTLILASLNKKQNSYELAVKEYKLVSSQLRALFDNFEASRPDKTGGNFPSRKTLPLPVDLGRIVKNFGKSVSEKFGTVTYQKGIEIEAEQNTPVKAVLKGTVEYEGWVKGLGNVLIVHHGNGFYSLSAHLFKSLKAKGNEVEQGETIGLVGDTGNSDKPSLYFELRENNKAVDPVVYFSEVARQKLASTN